MSKINIQNIPVEILTKIFASPRLEVEDLKNILLTCKLFNQVVESSNDLWRRKFFQRFPSLRLKHLPATLNYREEFKLKVKLRRDLKSFLKTLSPRFYPNKEFSLDFVREHLGDFLIEKQHRAYVVEELLYQIYENDLNKHLTERYYARRVLLNFRRLNLVKKFEKYWNLPTDQRFLEEGAILLSKWMQAANRVPPSGKWVRRQIDCLYNRIVDRVKESRPNINIPVRLKSDEKTVLNCVNYVLFHEMSFRGNTGSYYDLSNSYIDIVLKEKTGIPITLCVIYQAITRRLGVRCDPVSFPKHFLLRWKEHPEKTGEYSYTYIDVYHKGSFKCAYECLSLSGQNFVRTEDFAEAPTRQVLERMTRNLMREGNWLETQRLYLAINPADIDIAAQFAQNGSMTGIEDGIKFLAENFEIPEAELEILRTRLANSGQLFGVGQAPVRRRGRGAGMSNVEYGVGLVVHHKRFNYDCVITQWDPVCTASESWIHQMGVNRLPRGPNQPFYHVLAHDGSSRYAAEENLIVCRNPHLIDHGEVGVYFEEFNGIRYISNAENRAQYPDDEAFAKKFIAKHFKST